MDNRGDVGLDVLLHRVLQFAGESTLGAVPGGFHLHRVVARDQQQPDLPFQLLVVRTFLPRTPRWFHLRRRHLLELDLHHAVGTDWVLLHLPVARLLLLLLWLGLLRLLWRLLLSNYLLLLLLGFWWLLLSDLPLMHWLWGSH